MISTLCFLTTYRCNAKCDFCECGPRAAVGIGMDEMIRLIDEAVSLGTVALVVFSGGEPSLLREDLFRGIRHANRRGLLTRVVTNAVWGVTREKADRFVAKLMDAGLTEINLSVDDLHQQWIPLERVANAFHACHDAGLKCLIAHKQNRGATITPEFLSSYLGVELVPFVHGRTYTAEESLRLISSGTIIPVGRNEEFADLDNHIFGPWRSGCGSVLKDIVVGAEGNLLPCCGIVSKGIPELTREDLRQARLVDALDRANRDLMLNWIALEGPGAIIDFVRQKDPSIPFPDKFVGICHACNEVLTRNDVRRVIAAHIPEIRQRVSVHRGFLERGRSNPEVTRVYSRG